MWNITQSKNFNRLLDEHNSMQRHYKKLKEIKQKSTKSKFKNHRYERTLRKPKRHTKVKVNRAREIYRDNKKILKALDKISKRWGVFSPNQLELDQKALQHKTLGFKKKSNRDMIKENIRYLEKMKAVKPVYNKKMFEKEKNDYLYLKKNLKISNGKFRKVNKNNMKSNFREVKNIRKKRPKSAMAGLMQRSKSVQLMNNRVLQVKRSQNGRYSSVGLNKRPRSAVYRGKANFSSFQGGKSSQIMRPNSNTSSKILII
jgi:hypothetical protein